MHAGEQAMPKYGGSKTVEKSALYYIMLIALCHTLQSGSFSHVEFLSPHLRANDVLV